MENTGSMTHYREHLGEQWKEEDTKVISRQTLGLTASEQGLTVGFLPFYTQKNISFTLQFYDLVTILGSGDSHYDHINDFINQINQIIKKSVQGGIFNLVILSEKQSKLILKGVETKHE